MVAGVVKGSRPADPGRHAPEPGRQGGPRPPARPPRRVRLRRPEALEGRLRAGRRLPRTARSSPRTAPAPLRAGAGRRPRLPRRAPPGRPGARRPPRTAARRRTGRPACSRSSRGTKHVLLVFEGAHGVEDPGPFEAVARPGPPSTPTRSRPTWSPGATSPRPGSPGTARRSATTSASCIAASGPGGPASTWSAPTATSATGPCRPTPPGSRATWGGSSRPDRKTRHASCTGCPRNFRLRSTTCGFRAVREAVGRAIPER